MDYKMLQPYNKRAWKGLVDSREYWKGLVVKRKQEIVYYFNSAGIYTKISVYEINYYHLQIRGYYTYLDEYFLSDVLNVKYPDYVKKALLILELGDTVETLQKNILRFEKTYKRKEGIYNTIYQIKNDKFYFFNKDGIYSGLNEKEMLKSDVKIYIETASREKVRYRTHPAELMNFLNPEYDWNIFVTAMLKLKVGDTLEKLDEYYQNLVSEKEIWSKSLKRFITKIERPIFICMPENPKKDNTFDFINVDVNIISEWPNKKQYIKMNIKEINKTVLDKIEKSRSFKKYGIPVNYLKISKVTLRKDLNSLHYVIELKIK